MPDRGASVLSDATAVPCDVCQALLGKEPRSPSPSSTIEDGSTTTTRTGVENVSPCPHCLCVCTRLRLLRARRERLRERRCGGPGRRTRLDAASRRQGSDAGRRVTGPAYLGVHRDHPVALVDDDPAAGRRDRDPHLREGRRPRAARAAAGPDRPGQAAGVGREPRGDSRRRARRTSSTPRQQLARMRKLIDAGAVSRQELEQAETAHRTRRGAAEGRQLADPREPG